MCPKKTFRFETHFNTSVANVGLASPVLRREGLGPCLDVERTRAYHMNFETKFDHVAVLRHMRTQMTPKHSCIVKLKSGIGKYNDSINKPSSNYVSPPRLR